MTTNASIYDSIDEATKHYYLYRQQPEDSNGTHLRSFNSNFDVVGNYRETCMKIRHWYNMERRKLVETAYHALIRNSKP